MRLWTVVWSLAAVALGVFIVLNWQVLTAQTAINLLVAEVTAPLGLMMLGAMAVLALMCLVFIVWLETGALLRLARPDRLSAGAESGALAELRTHLDRQIGDLKAQAGTSADNLFARMDHMELAVKDVAQRVSHGGVE